jgi:hypothetical protein
MTTATPAEERGVSLSRGPALVLGTILLAAGLYFLYKQHTFVKLGSFPSGTAKPTGKVFLGIFDVNGWTGELTAVAGGLLLFGAAQHLLAKTMSLIVAVVLGVVAVWALVNHHSALGLFGAGIWTIIGFGASAVLLLFNTAIPRRSVTRSTAEPVAAREPVADRDPAAPVATREPVATRRTPVASSPTTDRSLDDAPDAASPGTSDAARSPASSDPAPGPVRVRPDADTQTTTSDTLHRGDPPDKSDR